MIKEKLYDFDTSYKVNYFFDLCKQKNEFLELLKTSKPVRVKKFKSNGTKWDIGGDYNIDIYKFYVNGGLIMISTITEGISCLLDFLINLAYIKNKSLLSSIFDEGSNAAITAIALDNDNIRFTVYDYGLMRYKKILSDIIINKKVFIKQFYNILTKLNKDAHKLDNRIGLIKKLDDCLETLKSYLENEEQFRQIYDIEKYIRIFDIAYKDLDGIWKFEICFENEEKADPDYWKEQKKNGKILDYDYWEQDATYGYGYKYEKEQTGKHFHSIKIEGEELRQSVPPDFYERVFEKNWVYSTETKKWYSSDEIMDKPKKDKYKIIKNPEYEGKISTDSLSDEDKRISSYLFDLKKYGSDNASLSCNIIIKSDDNSETNIATNYQYSKEIKKALEKVKNRKDVRFKLDYSKVMHVWQQKGDDNQDNVLVAIYNEYLPYDNHTEIDCFITEQKNFTEGILSAFDEFEYKINVMKHVLEVGTKLKIEENFKTGNYYKGDFQFIENFIGDYACVYKSSLDGAGIINKNFEWVIKPEYVAITGKTHPKYGQEILGFVRKYKWLNNIDGKLFAATKDDGKKFIMDINGEMKIPHLVDKISYVRLKDEIYFVFIDYNKTYVTNSKGEDIITLDYPVGVKAFISEDILIFSKNNKYGILDWKGNMIVDYIFSDIRPDDDKLDFIPVNYQGMWGFVNKEGKIFNMKIKDKKIIIENEKE